MTNLKTYLGKDRVYTKIPNAPRVSRLWVWNEGAKEYRPPLEGKTYYAYRYENGRRVYQSFDTLEEVRSWQMSVAALVTLPESPRTETTVVDDSPLFGDIVLEWKKRRFPHIAPGTRLFYEKIFRLHMGSLMHLPIREMTPKRLDIWIDELKAQSLVSKNRATRRSFRHELELLSTILRYYQSYHDDNAFQMPLKKRHTEASRLSSIKTVVQKDLTEVEFQKFREELLRLKSGERLAALASVQFYQALRISEAAGLFWEDVHLDWKHPALSRLRIVRSVWYSHRATSGRSH